MRAAIVSFAMLAGCTSQPAVSSPRAGGRELAATRPVDRAAFHRFPFAPRDVAIDVPTIEAKLAGAPLPTPVNLPNRERPPFVLRPMYVDKVQARVQARWSDAVDAAGARLDVFAPTVLLPVRSARNGWLASLDGLSPLSVTETRFVLLESFATAVTTLRIAATKAALYAFEDDDTKKLVAFLADESWDDAWGIESLPQARALFAEFLASRAAAAADVAYAARAPGYRLLLVKPEK